jgi:putative membrane protein
LAAINATLNGSTALLILGGWWCIRQGFRQTHRKLMLSAVAVSALFLVGYLTRVALTGTHRYVGTPFWKAVYLFVLFSHMAIAAVTPVLVLYSVYLGLKSRFADHKRIVRFTLPIWSYVSVTGVVVYVMLYHLRW